MSKNLNYELKNDKSYTCDPSKHGVEGSPGALGCETYGERPVAPREPPVDVGRLKCPANKNNDKIYQMGSNKVIMTENM
jgi:hypothetical protein